jgi:hypothetical protein
MKEILAKEEEHADESSDLLIAFAEALNESKRT